MAEVRSLAHLYGGVAYRGKSSYFASRANCTGLGGAVSPIRAVWLHLHPTLPHPQTAPPSRKSPAATTKRPARPQAMGAYRTILTHFSQRYPKFPEGLPAEGPAASTTAIAFDCMRVPLAALPLLPTLRPAVEYVLASEEAEEGVEEGAAAQARGAGS